MLAIRHRFHGYGSLRGVYQRGQTARGPLISLKYAKRDPKRPYRVAVVVSRKVNKSAVVRNRIRRRVYEAVRTTHKPIPAGTDLAFIVFDDKLADLPAAELRQSVDSLLGKAGFGGQA